MPETDPSIPADPNNPDGTPQETPAESAEVSPSPDAAPLDDLPTVFDAYSHSANATPGDSTDTRTPERFPHEIDALLAPPTAESLAANGK